MKYDIQVNPLNPVEYLACCGAFEILARFDVEATSWWELVPRPRFWIESTIDEASLLRCLIDSLSNWDEWQRSEQERGDFISQSVVPEDKVTEETAEENEATSPAEGESNEGIRLGLSFHLNDRVLALSLDWWYETLTTEKRIKEKSAWKMYAGQQTAEKISRKMVDQAAELLKQNPIKRITDLIRLSIGMTGRFGFDPRSSRNALDTGYSPNDLNLPIATFPFAELLAGIAAQHFFPQRTQQSKGITSSRGWMGNDVFQYALWTPRLPITLARMAAIGAGINNDDVIPFRAERANRDKYSNFRMATMTTWLPGKERSK
jgi:CRISPR-associated protein Csb3